MTITDTLALVVAICTAFYTVINLLMWFESRATRKQKITPSIIAYLKTQDDHNVICLYIKNIGEGCAKDVKIEMLKDYYQLGKENYPLSALGAIKKGLNIFPPQYELKYYIHGASEVNNDDADNYIKLKISYKRLEDSKMYSKIFELPFIQICGQNYSNPPETYIGQIPYYLKELNETIKNLINK